MHVTLTSGLFFWPVTSETQAAFKLESFIERQPEAEQSEDSTKADLGLFQHWGADTEKRNE